MICADILRTTKQKKYAYFSFHECRNHPIDFDMMNSKGFLVRSAKGLNDCTGVYNNFTDLKGFFQLVKQITSSERDIMANDTPYKNFEICYYDADFFSFKGRIKRINTKKQLLCFERIFVEGLYGDGDGFTGKEDHVWMSLTGFENYRVGDCLPFEAEVYRYIKTSRGKMIDFELKDPAGIRKVGEYEVPSDEQLRIQAAEQILCMDLCMFRDNCDGFCIANQEWKESMLPCFLEKCKIF